MPYIEVDLSDFSDDEIAEAYNERGLKDDDDTEDKEALTRIWLADREGRKDEAYSLMREYVLNKLGKVL